MNAANLIKALDTAFKAKLSVMIWGKPGVGKSAIVAWMATQRKWLLLDFRLVMRDTVDMRGVPCIVDGRTEWAVPAEFPKPGTQGIWFLDELNAAHPQVQVVAYQLTHDRAVGEYKVPDGWHIVCAGNYEADGAVVHKMSSALSSRVCHIDLEIDTSTHEGNPWFAWAEKAAVHPMVVAFLKWKPEFLHKFVKGDRSYPCPRTWEFVSNVMKTNPPIEVEDDVVTGLVGPVAAADYSAFVRLYRSLPDIQGIIANPKTAAIPNELGSLYAVASALANAASVKNFGNIVVYLERLPEVEFNVMSVKEAQARHPEVRSLPAFTSWCHKHADVTLGAAA